MHSEEAVAPVGELGGLIKIIVTRYRTIRLPELVFPVLRIAAAQPDIRDRRRHELRWRHRFGVGRLVDIAECHAMIDEGADRLVVRPTPMAALARQRGI